MRGVVLRVLAGLFAVSWLVLPGFGLIDLSVTWNPAWPQVLEAGWGLFATVVVGAAFVLVAVSPRRFAAGVSQLVVATGSLALSAVFAREGGLFALVVLLALQTAIVSGLLGSTRELGNGASVVRFPGVSRSLLLLAAAGAVPWLSYTLHLWRLNREALPDSDITLGIDHYSVQGALALSLAVLPMVAALRENVRPFVPACAGVAAFYLGLVSLAWPSSPAALGSAWSAVAMAWGLSLLAATVAQSPRLRPRADELGA